MDRSSSRHCTKNLWPSSPCLRSRATCPIFHDRVKSQVLMKEIGKLLRSEILWIKGPGHRQHHVGVDTVGLTDSTATRSTNGIKRDKITLSSIKMRWILRNPSWWIGSLSPQLYDSAASFKSWSGAHFLILRFSAFRGMHVVSRQQMKVRNIQLRHEKLDSSWTENW